MASIRCGHCGRTHASVSEVRACAENRQDRHPRTLGPPPAPAILKARHTKPHPPAPKTRTDAPSPSRSARVTPKKKLPKGKTRSSRSRRTVPPGLSGAKKTNTTPETGKRKPANSSGSRRAGPPKQILGSGTTMPNRTARSYGSRASGVSGPRRGCAQVSTVGPTQVDIPKRFAELVAEELVGR
jgi:hypothetical protein